MSYTYRGNHQGPDLFDEPLTSEGQRVGSPYDAVLRSERSGRMAYWYARGLNDREVARVTGYSSTAVQKWRESRGFRSNAEVLVER